jgi:hypothetical protein
MFLCSGADLPRGIKSLPAGTWVEFDVIQRPPAVSKAINLVVIS